MLTDIHCAMHVMEYDQRTCLHMQIFSIDHCSKVLQNDTGMYPSCHVSQLLHTLHTLHEGKKGEAINSKVYPYMEYSYPCVLNLYILFVCYRYLMYMYMPTISVL